ncbi:MAG: transposase family protein [Thermoplasmata archaeon]
MREHTGSLLHIDYRRASGNPPHLILGEDDASRMILAGGEFPEETTEHSIEAIEETLSVATNWGLKIRKLNTDRGAESFVSEESDCPNPTPGWFQYLALHVVRQGGGRAKDPQTPMGVLPAWSQVLLGLRETSVGPVIARFGHESSSTKSNRSNRYAASAPATVWGRFPSGTVRS